MIPVEGTPRVSVVIPLFNKAGTVRRALASALGQHLAELEVIVVNDGSTDEGPAIARAHPDPRVRVVDQANQGVSAARNRGIAETRAELVAFLDADDTWSDAYLGAILGLERSFGSCLCFATSYLYRHPNGISTRPVLRGISRGWIGVLEPYFAIAARSDPPVWTSAVAVRTSALRAVGGFPVGVTGGEDLLTWARLAVRGCVAYRNEPLAEYSLGSDLVGLPARIPDTPDMVGAGLRELLATAGGERLPGLREYLGAWHRIRATSFLQLARCGEAWVDARSACRYAPRRLTNWIYLGVAAMPPGLARTSIGFINGLRRARRAVSRSRAHGQTGPPPRIDGTGQWKAET